MGSSENGLYLRVQIIWVFPTSISSHLMFSYSPGNEDVLLYRDARVERDRFSDKPTLSVLADNVDFSQINRVFLKKPTLSADNVGFFRETYFI